MATRYCDHGLYPAYAAIPSWGVAEDGDGTSAAVAVPATAEVVFTGNPSSGSIAVLGATLSPGWGGGADACANALAATINAATNSASSPAGITRKSQLRCHVYARGPANGAPAGTCQIMMRQGTAAVNGQIAVTHTLTNVSSPGTIYFSGGAGGAWGYVFNNSAVIWPNSLVIASYGIWAAQLPYCGDLLPGDVVEVRAGKTIVLAGGTSQSWTMAALGSRTAPVVFRIDDGTVWPADGAAPVLKFVKNGITNNAYTAVWGHAAATFAHIKGRKYSNGQRSLVWEAGAALGSNIPTLRLSVGGPVRFDYLDMVALGTVDAAPGPQSSVMTQIDGSVQPSNPGDQTLLFGCRQKQPGNAPSAGGYSLVSDSNSNNRKVRLVDHTFELTAPTQAWSAGAMSFFHSGAAHRYEFLGCKFVGFVSGSALLYANANVAADSAATFLNCSLGGITNWGPHSTGQASGTGGRGTQISSHVGTRDFCYEVLGQLFVEWQASKGRPTLNAVLPDGVTPWSIFGTPTVNTAMTGRTAPADMPALSKILPPAAVLAEAPRTLTVNCLMESTLAWTAADLSLLLTYTNAVGELCVIDTYDSAGGAVSTSTAAWSATSWNGQTWLKRQFQVTTPDAVKAESELSVVVRMHGQVANNTQGIILDPEVVVA